MFSYAILRRLRRILGRVGILCLLLLASAAAAEIADDLLPLKPATPDAVGPLNIPSLTLRVAGTAFLSPGNAQPDIFIYARSALVPALYLARWLYNTPEDTPVFSTPHLIAYPTASMDPITVAQTPDNTIHAFTANGKTITQHILDKQTLTFRTLDTITITSLPSDIASLATAQNPDGSIELIMEVNGDYIAPRTPAPTTNVSTHEWRPFDAAGISTSGIRYKRLYAAHTTLPLSATPSNIRRLSPSNNEVPHAMYNIAVVTLDPSRPRAVITGSNRGTFAYYPNTSLSSVASDTRHYIAGPDGNILQHPQVCADAAAYPDPVTGLYSSILSAGENSIYLYKFTANFAKNGNPIYEKPVPILQRNADLHSGTLPSIAITDWDGDGILDIITANSEGNILFFKNTSDNENPAFLPGTRVKTKNGLDIHHQAEYKGSVQGFNEARFGYLSVTPFDWSGNGVPDLITSDITGNYYIYLNTGTPGNPQLESRQPLYCDGIPLHGAWRCQPAITSIDGNPVLFIVDDDHQLRHYHRIDNHNVSDAGKLTLTNGKLISTHLNPGGATGRTKLSFADVNLDGLPDLAIGTSSGNALPDPINGYPRPTLGAAPSTPLVLINTGNASKFTFSGPILFHHQHHGFIQTFGGHERSAILTPFHGGGSLFTANEFGQLYLFHTANISLRSSENSLPASNPNFTLPHNPSSLIPAFKLPQALGENFTIAFFFKTTDEELLSTTAPSDDSHPMTLLHATSSDNSQRLVLRLHQSHLYIVGSNNSGVTWPSAFAPTHIRANQTYHVAIVKQGGTTHVYLNGILTFTNPLAPCDPGAIIPSLPNLDTIYYGRFGSIRPLIGSMSQPVFISNTALTPGQVLALASDQEALAAFDPTGFTDNSPAQITHWQTTKGTSTISLSPNLSLLPPGLSRGPGVTQKHSPNNTWGAAANSANVNSRQAAINKGSHITFTITPNPNHSLNLNLIHYNLVKFNGSYQWQYALDNSTTFTDLTPPITLNQNTVAYNTNGTPQPPVPAITNPDLQNITTPVTFRILLWNTSTPFAIGRLSGPDLLLEGSSIEIPPPIDTLTLSQDQFLLYALTQTTDPTQSDGTLPHLPVATVTNNTLALAFTPTRGTFTYEVQRSTDLQTWTTIKTLSPSEITGETLTIPSPENILTTPRQFLRLKITDPPVAENSKIQQSKSR